MQLNIVEVAHMITVIRQLLWLLSGHSMQYMFIGLLERTAIYVKYIGTKGFSGSQVFKSDNHERS